MEPGRERLDFIEDVEDAIEEATFCLLPDNILDDLECDDEALRLQVATDRYERARRVISNSFDRAMNIIH
jgi:hypothetical protein